MSGLLGLIMGAMGAYLLVWAARSALSAGRAAPPAAATATPGQWVLAAGQVLTPPQPTTSPLQGMACVWWHVRAVRIRERNASARASGLQVQVDLEDSSDIPFVVRTDHGDVTVHAQSGRMGSGLTTVHRDQASVGRSLQIAGRSHDLPPVAHGTRQVKEGILVPGQPVWVEGRLSAAPDGPVITADPDRPVLVETTSLDSRRRTTTRIAALAALVGVVLLVAAVSMLAG